MNSYWIFSFKHLNEYTWLIINICWKYCDFFDGIGVFLGINVDITLPVVSIHNVNCVTSTNTIGSVLSHQLPDKISDWTETPYVTSSGLIDFFSIDEIL